MIDVRIQSIHFDADVKLIEFVKKKVEKLSLFHDHIMSADVYLKFDSASSQIKDKTADIKIHVPGATLFATDTSKTFEEAIDEAVDSLERQIKKSKERTKN